MTDEARMHAERKFPDAEALADALALEISQRLRTAVAERGSALLAVSGGRSPLGLFRRLSQTMLPWHAVTVTLVDERWVAADDEASNERLVRDHLLVAQAAAAHFVPLKNNAATPAAGAAATNTALSELALPFDVVVLGMGEDGHTASLFPRAPGLLEALDNSSPALCAAVHPRSAPHARLSLTLRALLSSRWLVLPLQGESKLRTYRTALEPGPVEQMPIRAILRQRQAPVEVWYSESGQALPLQ